MNTILDIAGRIAATTNPEPSPSRVLLVGARRDTRRLIRRLVDRPWGGLPIVGFVHAGHARKATLRPRGTRRHRHMPLHPQTDPVPVLGHIERLDEWVDRSRATHVVVAVSSESGPQLRPLVDQLNHSDIAVHWVAVDASRLDLGTLIGAPADSTDVGEHAIRRPHFLGPIRGQLSRGRIAKRIMDIAVSGMLLCLLAPLFAVVALAVLISSGRPVFYMQERVGQGGRLFRMYKFRSMRRDAERETGPIWASDHDNRCTRIGDWLRHTNIDELPQLINVLRGDMSLVGPRPERPIFVNEFRSTVPGYDLRHAVPGGMTGWAQVHGWRGRTSLRKRLQYDLDYIERWSIALDFRILLMTIQHVFWGKTSWNDSRRPQRSGA